MSFCEPAKNGSPKIANLSGILTQVGKINSLGTVLDITMFETMPPIVQIPAKMPKSLRFFQYFFLKGSGTISGLPIMNWIRFSGVILLSCCIIQGLISQALGDLPLVFFSSAFVLDMLKIKLYLSSKNHLKNIAKLNLELLHYLLFSGKQIIIVFSTMLIISYFQYWCYLVLILSLMRMLSRPSRFIISVLPFKKYSYTFAYGMASTWRDQTKNVPMKPYQKLLLGDDLGQMPKLPSVKLLDSMRSRQISRIMLYNQQLNHEEVFESQIECFYSMVSRFEPSIQSMSLLLQQIYKNMIGLNSEYPQSRLEAEKRALIPVMKPSLLSKLVYIGHIIEPYYNEYLKMMLTTFFVRSILFSESSAQRKGQQKVRLDRLREDVYKKRKELFVEGEKIKPERYAEYFQNKEKQLSKEYPSLQLQDFLQVSHYILSNQYYTEEVLDVVVNKLEKYGLQDKQHLVLSILKIKLLGVLHKFQNFRAVQAKKTELFQTIYNQNISRYFTMISNSQLLFQIANSHSQILQLHLVITEFLSNEHFNRAKDIYYKIIYDVFDTNSNGCLLSDIRKVRGLFEIILIMYNHRDTKKIHQLLKKIQKTLVLFPFVRMQKFQTYVYACQKFGYKSDIVAERYFNTQIQVKQRLASLKGVVPHLHQLTRQMNLARKFLTYLEIVEKGTKEQIELAHRYASELFDPNIWYCLSENQSNAYSYFTTPSFNSFLYFTKVSIYNLTSGLEEKKKIDYMAQKINLVNINKKHNQILYTTTQSMRLSPIKLAHSSFWRHNHHSRMLSTLKLAVHQYKHLHRRDHKEANSFIEQFLQKTINNPAFYNVFKSNMSYPGIFDMMLQIMEYANSKQYPIQNRDLHALKKLFSKNLQKLKKMQQNQLSKETEKIKYQSFLDAVQYNIIYLPYLQEHYGLTGIILNLQNSLTYDSMIRFKAYKQNLRMQIQTFCKFRRQSDVEVIVNYLDYPHVADVLIRKKESTVVLMIKIADDPQQSIVNYKQLYMQKNAEQYWRKKGYTIIYLRSKKQIDEFDDVKIRDVINRLQEQKI